MTGKNDNFHVPYEDFKQLQEDIKRLEAKIDQNNGTMQEMINAFKVLKAGMSFIKFVGLLAGILTAVFTAIKQFPHWKQ